MEKEEREIYLLVTIKSTLERVEQILTIIAVMGIPICTAAIVMLVRLFN